MTSVRDPFDVLTTHRPDEPTLQADWPSPWRAELLARVLDAAATPTTANGPTRAWAGTGVGATKPTLRLGLGSTPGHPPTARDGKCTV